ncbi:hypothetical protein ES705_45217 [subsurface metagenome]
MSLKKGKISFMVIESCEKRKIPPPSVPGECPPFSKFDPYTFQKLCRDIVYEEEGIKL